MHSIISRTFTMSSLSKMKYLIDDCVDELINNFNTQLKNNKNVKKAEINVFQAFEAFSIDAVVQMGYGTKIHSLIGEKNNPIIESVKAFFHNVAKHFTLSFFVTENFIFLPRNKLILSFFEKFTLKITKERMRKYENQKSKRNDFLQLMLDSCDISSSLKLNHSSTSSTEKSVSKLNHSSTSTEESVLNKTDSSKSTTNIINSEGKQFGFENQENHLNDGKNDPQLNKCKNHKFIQLLIAIFIDLKL